MTDPSFILASASPRRKALLEDLGFSFTVYPSHLPENFLTGETPRDHVLRLSLEKSRFVARRHPGMWVLGADTVVVAGGEILGKPHNPGEARDRLRKLAGRAHEVITGFALVRDGEPPAASRAVTSRVVFRDMASDEVAWYARTPEPYDKAGGYAVQGLAAAFIEEIHGSYTNVVGLPLCEVVSVLKAVGAVRFFERGDNGIGG